MSSRHLEILNVSARTEFWICFESILQNLALEKFSESYKFKKLAELEKKVKLSNHKVGQEKLKKLRNVKVKCEKIGKNQRY